MSDPHFKIGDQVRVQEAPASSPADAFVEAFLCTSMLGIYEVTAILPDAGSQPQYRLKGIAGRLERGCGGQSDFPCQPDTLVEGLNSGSVWVYLAN